MRGDSPLAPLRRQDEGSQDDAEALMNCYLANMNNEYYRASGEILEYTARRVHARASTVARLTQT